VLPKHKYIIVLFDLHMSCYSPVCLLDMAISFWVSTHLVYIELLLNYIKTTTRMDFTVSYLHHLLTCLCFVPVTLDWTYPVFSIYLCENAFPFGEDDQMTTLNLNILLFGSSGNHTYLCLYSGVY